MMQHSNDTISVGDKVYVSKYECNGIVRYIGKVSNKKGIWHGIELEKPNGKNNGTIDGKSYFKCQHKFGVFVRKTGISFAESGMLCAYTILFLYITISPQRK